MQLCPIKLDFQFIIHCWSRQRPQQAEWNQFIRPGPRLDGAIPQSVSSGCLLLHTKGEKVVQDLISFFLSLSSQVWKKKTGVTSVPLPAAHVHPRVAPAL